MSGRTDWPWRTIIAGGGTGGHVFPALSLATSIRSLGVPFEDILLVGSKRGQESLLLKDAPYPVVLLPGRGLQRKISPKAFGANLAAISALFIGLLRAMKLHLFFRPSVVVSVGGYGALASSLAAVMFHCPLILVNIDAVPGLTHKLLGRFAKASAVAFGTTPLPRTVVTGTPVRQEIQAIQRTPVSCRSAREERGWSSKDFVVGFVGGSLGARSINTAAFELAQMWQEFPSRLIVHVTGRREYDFWQQRTAELISDKYQVVAFEEDMAGLYEALDVLVCRAGAVTVAELAVAGLPSILVPLPGAPGDHQSANARALADATAAVSLRDQTCSGRSVGELLEAMWQDKERLAKMSAAGRKIARPNAALHVGELVMSHAKSKSVLNAKLSGEES